MRRCIVLVSYFCANVFGVGGASLFMSCSCVSPCFNTPSVLLQYAFHTGSLMSATVFITGDLVCIRVVLPTHRRAQSSCGTSCT